MTAEEILKKHYFDTDNERLFLIAKIAMREYAEQFYSLWLVAEGEYAVLKIEVNKDEWVELIRERLDSPFSHIIEPLGIQAAIKKTM